MSEQYDLLKSILLEKSVRTGTFTLASGKVSDLYVDCRMTALDPVGATLVGALGWKLVKEDILPRFPEVAAIGGMTMGADPISLAVGMTSALEGAEKTLQVFTVRKEPKDHGRGRRIEGNFQAGDTVVVVDAIEAEGGRVAAALVLLDREEGGRQAIEERGIPVYPLYTRTSLLGH